MRIGIMGGTFDPIHYGHILSAGEVAEKAGLNQVLFIPSGIPAHKKGRYVTDPYIRYEMLLAAIKEYKDFAACDIEIKRKGNTYTIDTLRELHDIYNIKSKDTEFIYIIGADVVKELDTWREYQEDFRLCRFAAIMRPGYSKKDFEESLNKMKALGADIFPVEGPQLNISSSIIRDKVKRGESIENIVPEDVVKIIKRENLYADR